MTMTVHNSYAICGLDGKAKMTRSQAKSSAKRLDGTHAYRCPSCSTWHVGHTPRRIRRG